VPILSQKYHKYLLEMDFLLSDKERVSNLTAIIVAQL